MDSLNFSSPNKEEGECLYYKKGKCTLPRSRYTPVHCAMYDRGTCKADKGVISFAMREDKRKPNFQEGK